MRATRQTELERDFPLPVVCSWLGNTEAVAKKNYLLVTDADFAKATEIRGTPGARADQKTERRGTNVALQTTANDTPTNERALRISGESYVFREIHRVFEWRRGEVNTPQKTRDLAGFWKDDAQDDAIHNEQRLIDLWQRAGEQIDEQRLRIFRLLPPRQQIELLRKISWESVLSRHRPPVVD